MRNRILITVAGLALALFGLAYWSLREGTPAGDIAVSAAAEPDEPAPGIATAKREATPARERVAEDSSPIGAAASDAGPAPEELWGRVVAAATGAPVAGADVRLLHCDADDFERDELLQPPRLAELRRSVSGEDGGFRFSVARGRGHRLQIRATGFARTVVPHCTGGSEIFVQLSAGATLAGFVRDRGNGVAGVPVRVLDHATRSELARIDQTRADGSFEIDELPASDVFVRVAPPGRPEGTRLVQLVAGATSRAEFDFAAGTTLRGRVLDVDNRSGIAGAELCSETAWHCLARSGADGSFEVPDFDIHPDSRLHVRATGYAESILYLADAHGAELTIPLVRGGEVCGRILADRDRLPPDLRIVVATRFFIRGSSQLLSHTDRIEATIHDGGRFIALGLRPDQHYSLFVTASGSGARIHALPRTIASGERLDVGDVVLRPAGGAEGRVVDPDGRPLAGIRVRLFGTNAGAEAWVATEQKPSLPNELMQRTTRTDQAGRFRFTDLAAGGYQVRVDPPGHATPVSTAITITDGKILERIELIASAGRALEGKIAYPPGGQPDASRLVYLAATHDAAGTLHALVRPDGGFRFEGLAPGSYRLGMAAGPNGWTLPARIVDAGATGVVLELQRAVTIAGRVVDADGKPRKAFVWARSEGDAAALGMRASDAEGQFEIEVPHDFHGSVEAVDRDDQLIRGHSHGHAAGATGILVKLSRPGPKPWIGK
jgi:protocatechuate 3,4-dioxygenase beta subunit